MKNVQKEVVFLCGNGNYELSSDILKVISELFGQTCTFDHINFNKWPEGEFDNRIVQYEKIKGKVVVFFQSMYTLELSREALDLIWACKHQYGARSIIGVFPFLLNRRQDPMMSENDKEPFSKKVAKPDEIQRLKQTIHLLRVCGVDEMLVATPHSVIMARECANYGIKFHEIDPSSLFATTLETYVHPENRSLVKIYSPDAGSLLRAINLAKILHCPALFSLKNRATNNKTSIVSTKEKEVAKMVDDFKAHYNFDEIYYADPNLVAGQIIAIVEDEVASCTTVNDTGLLLKQYQAKAILLFATHAVLTFGWRNKLFHLDPFTKIIMTDTIPRGNDKRTGGKIFDLSLAPLFGSSIFRILDRI